MDGEGFDVEQEVLAANENLTPIESILSSEKQTILARYDASYQDSSRDSGISCRVAKESRTTFSFNLTY